MLQDCEQLVKIVRRNIFLSEVLIVLLPNFTCFFPISFEIDLFSLYILFSQCRSCDGTLESCFFEISSYSRPTLRKQNVQIEFQDKSRKHGSDQEIFRV